MELEQIFLNSCNFYLVKEGSAKIIPILRYFLSTEANASLIEALEYTFSYQFQHKKLFFISKKILQNLKYPEDLDLAHLIIESLQNCKHTNPYLFKPEKNTWKWIDYQNLKKIDPALIETFFSLFDLKFYNLEFIFRLEFRIEKDFESKNFSGIVNLASHLGIEEKINEEFDLIPLLTEPQYLEFLIFFIKKNEGLQKKAIYLLLEEKKWKLAEKVLEKLNLNEDEYPEIEKNKFADLVTFYIKSKNSKGFLHFIDFVINHWTEKIGDLIEFLAEKNYPYNKNISAYLHLKYPEVEISHETEQLLAGIEPVCEIELPTKFGPYNPEFQIELALPREFVIIIDTETKLENLIIEADLLAFDSEYRSPYTKHSSNPEISILQIAQRNEVYIIDLILLKDSPNLPYKLIKIFNSPSVKIGVNFGLDLKILENTIQMPEKIEGEFLDLLELYKRYIGNNSGGLQRLCIEVLGKSLCKGEELSNWLMRPLRESEIHYAALDAFVLIELYEEIKNQYEIREESKTEAGCEHKEVRNLCHVCGDTHQEECKFGNPCKYCLHFFHSEEVCSFIRVINN